MKPQNYPRVEHCSPACAWLAGITAGALLLFPAWLPAQSQGPRPALNSSGVLPPGYVQRGFGQPVYQGLYRPLQQLDQGRKVQIWHVQGRVYMLVGAGPNITVQVGDNALTVVDAGPAAMSGEVRAAIRDLSDLPIEYIIDTSADADEVSGSSALSSSGFAMSGQPGEPTGASIVAQLNTQSRLTGAAVAGAEVPTDAYEDHWALFNSEPVLVTHAPAAHSNGDSYVFFRRSDVISTGELLDMEHYPVIEADRGGSIDGIIDGLNQILELMVPEVNEEGGTWAVPGHGRICDQSEVANYRDALTIIRGRIQFYVSKGMTLQQVLDSQPTSDYDGLYGADSGPWTTRMFIAAIYHDAALAHGRGKDHAAR